MDFLPLELDRLNRSHTDVFQHLEVGKILLRKGHPETNAFQAFDVLTERFHLLVIEKIGILRPDDWEVVDLVYAHGFDFFPFTFFPVASILGNLTDVDLWVEVGRKVVAVVTRIGV